MVIRIIALLGLVIVFIFGVATSFAAPPAGEGSPAVEKDAASAEGTSAADAADEVSKYLRVSETEQGEPRALETAIVRFAARPGTRWDGAVVDLVGVVHIGEPDYYKDLNRRFRDYDSVLYELVAEEGTRISPEQATAGRSPVSAMQLSMRDMLDLEFQLEHIDYNAANFRHADMSPEEFAQDMQRRGDSLLKMFFRMLGAGMAAQSSAGGTSDAALLMAMLAPDRARQLKRVMARQFEDLEAATAGMADAEGRSTLITERNGKAFQVLRAELEAGQDEIAVFYGAGHLPDMAERLEREFQMRPVSTEWLTAWDLQRK